MTTKTPNDVELKARHRAVWASGDYPTMVEQWLHPLGPRLVEACGIAPGMKVLDVAAGTGNAALPAAERGAHVTASDLTPELLEAGRHRAEAKGLGLEWVEADAERLPFSDGAFDVVMSSLGVMFAPHHQQAADELVRVCRPGGTVGLLSWTPEGMIGALFRTIGPFAPPPPARRAAAAPVGQRGPPARAAGRPRGDADARAGRGGRHGVRAARRLRRALPRQLRADDRGRGQRPPERARGGVRGRTRRVLRGVEPRHARAGPLRARVPAGRGHPPMR